MNIRPSPLSSPSPSPVSSPSGSRSPSAAAASPLSDGAAGSADEVRARAFVARTLALTSVPAAGLLAYQARFGPSQFRMLEYDDALWEAREDAALAIAEFLQPPPEMPLHLTRLELGGVLVSRQLLRAVAGQPALQALTLATLASREMPPARPPEVTLAWTVGHLPQLATLRLSTLPDPQPFATAASFAVGEPLALAAAAAAAPTLAVLEAEDVWDEDAPLPDADSDRPWTPLPPRIAALCLVLEAHPALRSATLDLRELPMTEPPAPWRRGGDGAQRLTLARSA